jgi:hypothetical protein
VAQHSDRLILERFDNFIFEAAQITCHVWIGGYSPGGYGQFNTRRGRRPIKAHRFAWELAHAMEVPPGLVVKHTCNHPYCVNPDHLVVDTQAGNLRDARNQGRLNVKLPRGEDHPKSKFTEADVRAIRDRHAAGGVTYAQLAREYGVAFVTIWNIVWRKRWKHVQ